VGAEEGDHLAGFDGERDVGDGTDFLVLAAKEATKGTAEAGVLLEDAVGLGKSLYLDDRHWRRLSFPREDNRHSNKQAVPGRAQRVRGRTKSGTGTGTGTDCCSPFPFPFPFPILLFLDRTFSQALLAHRAISRFPPNTRAHTSARGRCRGR